MQNNSSDLFDRIGRIEWYLTNQGNVSWGGIPGAISTHL